MIIKCHPRAYAQCPHRHLCCSLNDADFAEGSECDKFNQKILDQPMTNADRIRGMTDKELIEFLGFHSLCAHISSEHNAWCQCHNCTDCLVEWLQQPAKEETL